MLIRTCWCVCITFLVTTAIVMPSGLAMAGKPVKFRSTYLSDQNGYALAVNDSNTIVGYLTGTVVRNQPYVWTVMPQRRSIDVVATALSCGDYPEGRAYDVKNDDPSHPYDGQWICGELLGETIGDQQAAIWLDPAGPPLELPVTAGTLRSSATALNTSGVIVGWRDYQIDGNVVTEAVAWAVIAKEFETVCLGPISLELPGRPLSINANGLAVGIYEPPMSFENYATGWQIDFDPVNETLTLQNIESYSPHISQMLGVNDAGFKCGTEYTEETAWDGLLLDPLNVKLPLASIPNPIQGNPNAPPPPGYPIQFDPEYATALNNLSPPQVVGSVFYASALWQGDQVIDLSTIVGRDAPFVREPKDVNDNTWIVGEIGGSFPRPVVMFPE